MAGQHGEPGAGRTHRQLRDQARLADARLARDDREPRLTRPRPVQQRDERRDLVAPPDEDRALHPLAHKLHAATDTAITQSRAAWRPGGQREPGHAPGPFGILILVFTPQPGAAWWHDHDI